ncbi:MFS transporter [Acidisphaera sp. S103]|uniref:MFS transporter n=1 Tax=Acidisphaera sp. S103 TaxID=1747223 RepID=UPI00131B848C|nr:MFS transporter [Acidisphaera sp. S103]
MAKPAAGAFPGSGTVSAETLGKVLWRILPFLFLCYVVNYLDRVNVGLAALAMNKDLNLSPSQFGWGAGLFFIGYFLFQIPSNLMLQAVGARRWIAVIMVTWGVISTATAFVSGPITFGLARFLLGIAEGGFVPGVFLYLTQWFPGDWRAKATATFLVGIPVASIIGSPISGGLLSMHEIGGLRSWQLLLILEGVPAILLSLACLFVLVDRPEQAPWLDPEEKQQLIHRLDTERRQIEQIHRFTLAETLANGRVITLAGINFCSIIGGFGVQLWLPQIIKGFGLNNAQVGWINAIPYVFGAVAMILWARSSDRATDRTWHVASTTLLAAVGLAIASCVGSPTLSLVALTLTIVGTLSFQATFWAVPATFLTGRAAAAGIAFIVAVGNLGGFAGPYLIGRVKEATNSYTIALLVLAGFLACSTIMMLMLGNPARRGSTAIRFEEEKGRS